MPEIKVNQDEANLVLPEVLATAIKRIGDGVALWNKAGLKRRALLLLLHDQSGVSLGEITRVLNGMQELEKTYLMPQPTTPAKK